MAKEPTRKEIIEAVEVCETIEELLLKSIVKHPEHAAEYEKALVKTRTSLVADKALLARLSGHGNPRKRLPLILRFNYPNKTTRPAGLEKWEDRSWCNDASASCTLPCPTKGHQQAVLILWAQPDDKAEREFPDEPVYWLEWIPDGEDWSDEKREEIVKTDDIAVVLEKAAAHVKAKKEAR